MQTLSRLIMGGTAPALVLILLGTAVHAHGAQSDIRLSSRSFDPENSFGTFTSTGSLVGSLTQVPYPGSDPLSEYVRDTTTTSDGVIWIYNGTFQPFLSGFNPATSTFTHYTAAGWSTVNNVTYGGIAARGTDVFVTDMDTAGEDTFGIIRFDTLSGSFTRFDALRSYFDLNMGLDGFLYGLTGGSGSQDTLVKLNPTTGQVLDNIVLPFDRDHRAVAVDRDGGVFIASFAGEIVKYDLDAAELDIISGMDDLSDLDMQLDGTLIAGSWQPGDVYLLPASLDSFTSFTGPDTNFVSPVGYVPEPAGALGLAALGLLLLRWRSDPSS